MSSQLTGEGGKHWRTEPPRVGGGTWESPPLRRAAGDRARQETVFIAGQDREPRSSVAAGGWADVKQNFSKAAS